MIIFCSDRISNLEQLAWMGCSICKEVDDFYRAKAPTTGKGNTTPNGWIVLLLIGVIGIEHDKDNPWMVRIPGTPQGVTICACWVKYGPALPLHMMYQY